MSKVGRRSVLKAGCAATLALKQPLAAAASKKMQMFVAAKLFSDVQIYASAGNKQSGGEGDRWTAEWVNARLENAGFSVERQGFDVPWFESDNTAIVVDGARIPLIAQPLAVQTPPQGMDLPLRLSDSAQSLEGAIAVIRLPYRRWSSILDRAAKDPIADAVGRGATAVILVTTGPTGEALYLNTPADRPFADTPIALLAPSKSIPVIEAARQGRSAVLKLTGRGGKRRAENVIGRMARPGGKWLVVSTPRSGWTDCVGERGPGIATWLALADWMPRHFTRHNLLFVCNSGHEFENLGASHIVKEVGPPTADTEFWMHLGANVAARDYQEMPGRLLPLPSADPYRFLMTSTDFVEKARQIFEGQPGLEMAYPSSDGTAGELSEIVKAGYTKHAGIFGAHRHHHAESDKLSVVAPDPLAATALAVRDLLTALIPA